MKLRILLLGLSISSSWGNGHATVYRALVRELLRRGHSVLFLEREKPWYAQNRDLPLPLSREVCLYHSVDDLKARFADAVRAADCVIVGSYVPEGGEIGRWVTATARGITAFYDIDTPVTLAQLDSGRCEYLDAGVIPKFSLYLSFTGGPMLRQIEQKHGARMARAFYCCVDPQLYFPDTAVEKTCDLGHIGTYSPDRLPPLESLLLAPARQWPGGRFVVAGPLYPETMRWPANVRRIEHIPPCEHRAFYNAQRFTLNITRSEMIRAGYSPSVRLFEAAACGTPIITDLWPGLGEFFEPGKEILAARSERDVLEALTQMSADEARAMAERARQRVLREHTAERRAAQLEEMIAEAAATGPRRLRDCR